MLHFLRLVCCGSNEVIALGDKDRCLTLLLGRRLALTFDVGECLLNVGILIIIYGFCLGTFCGVSRQTLRSFFGASMLFQITLVEVLARVAELVFDLLHDVARHVYNLSEG